MPRKKRKSKSFYIDTNVALDYATNRDIQTVTLLENIKDRGWKCVSSSFLAMEMADYKKDYLYITKAINRKIEVRNVLRGIGDKGLRPADFEETDEWFGEFRQRFKNLELYDFMQDENAWTLAAEISLGSNLMAPDVIHIASAIIGARHGYCEVLITKDKVMREETEMLIKKYKLRGKLKVMTPAQVKQKYL
jgi:predicted nucleic acid-binding protein